MYSEKNNPLVSIIIPTLNRANIIGETLNSIVDQTYTNWECIVIDDGSTDRTKELLMSYVNKDSRFHYFLRPESHRPGGNGARNYGFKLSKGQYVQWFDSDDLMVPEKLEIEVKALNDYEVDFVVSKRKYFNKPNNTFFNYDFQASDVTFESFAIDYISWHTPDLMLKKSIAETITFNELMSAGQEHNFNCKLLLQTNKLFFTDKFLTLRRYSPNSIQGKRDNSIETHLNKTFEAHWLNYLDLKDKAKSNKFNRYSLLQCVRCYLESKHQIQLPSKFTDELKQVFPKRYFLFYLARISNFIVGKYYVFYRLLKQNEVFNTYHIKKHID